MFIESSALSDEARVWVYPASRKFYAQEVDEIINKLHSFVSIPAYLKLRKATSSKGEVFSLTEHQKSNAALDEIEVDASVEVRHEDTYAENEEIILSEIFHPF